jgi:ATP phosphoribosyltransferase
MAENYFSRKGIVANMITISGFSEIMPKYGYVDLIFDIVETARALKENRLGFLKRQCLSIRKC